MRLELRPWDFALSVPLSERRPRYAESNRFRFSSTGQFEIFVRTRVLPVAASHCRRYVMARMPATDPADPAAGAKLQAKRALFDRLQALKSSGSGSAAVVVELNPYVRVASETPLRLELTQCNVFFRQVNGAYVDRVEP